MLFDDVIESVILIFSLDKHLIQCRFFQILKFFKFSLMKGDEIIKLSKTRPNFFLFFRMHRKIYFYFTYLIFINFHRDCS